MRKKVIIIGSGLAGLSLASELADDFDVEVFEAKSYLGGRASDRTDPKEHDPVPIGPHVFGDWYHNFFRFLRKIEAPRSILWEGRVFIDVFHRIRHFALRFYRLPAPLYVAPWLLFHPDLNIRDKFSNIRLIRYIYFSSYTNLEQLDSRTAEEFLRSMGVSDRSITYFWRFIILSLLNVPMHRCSAAEFALLVKLWSHLRHRRFGFPRVGLGDVFADEAERYIVSRGGSVRRRHRVRNIAMSENMISHVEVEGPHGIRYHRADIVVSSLNPVQLRDILPEELREREPFSKLAFFEGVPYFSVNIWFDRKITHKKFWALLDTMPGGKREFLNTDFYDLSNIYESRKGHSYIASNVIYSHEFEHLSDEEILSRTIDEIRLAFPKLDAAIRHAHIHRTPYVIYAPTPGSRGNKFSETNISNFFLTGDWTETAIPQCMEAAVRSGYRCAERIYEREGRPHKICIEGVY